MGDLAALQALIDASWAKAGKAAREAWPEPNRIRADGVATFLGQQRFCVIATTSPAGNPRLVPGSRSTPRNLRPAGPWEAPRLSASSS